MQAGLVEVLAAAPAAPAPSSVAAAAAEAAAAAVPAARLPQGYTSDCFTASLAQAKKAHNMAVHESLQMGYFIAQARASRAGSLGLQDHADVYADTTDAIFRVYADLANKAAAHAAALRAAAFASAFTHVVENDFDNVSNRLRWDAFSSFRKAVAALDVVNAFVPPAPPQ